jgi:hypothetical protein
MSVPVISTLPAVSSGVVMLFGATTGLSFTGVTVIVTVAGLENPLAPIVPPLPSRTR